jgi:ABC-type antimicrobial peptide transport system permease subunit
MSAAVQSEPARSKSSRQPWRIAAVVAVATGVCFSVLLISVAFGVSFDIQNKLSSPALKHLKVVNVGLIDSILVLLTVVVTVAMLCQTATATFTLGVTVMQSRREEIALRRQSGVLRSTLMAEFIRRMFWPCLLGGLIGEALGIASALLLSHYTVLPIRFNAVALLAAFPVTVLLALAATLGPAWRYANASPALLRRQ